MSDNLADDCGEPISLLSPARLSEISGFGLEKAILPENGKNRFFMSI